jgi:Zn-dependent protease
LPEIQLFLQRLSIHAIPLILAITFHEAAHGYVAYRRGDPTARMLGRVTLNPIPHIDPVGTILLPGFLLLTGSGILFGWARPVPVNYRLLQDPKRDPVYVAAAGVVTNLMLAAFSGMLLRLIALADPAVAHKAYLFSFTGVIPAADTTTQMFLIPLALMCVASIRWNVLLAIFNMIPIPPLDGGRIAVGLLPPGPSQALASVERYGILILVALLFFDPFGILRGLLIPLIRILNSLFLGG